MATLTENERKKPTATSIARLDWEIEVAQWRNKLNRTI